MPRIDMDIVINAGLAILGGLLMRWSFGLHPVWWLAWVASAPLPGATLLGRVPTAAPSPSPTLYSYTGDVFGWLCTAAALACCIRFRRGPAASTPKALPGLLAGHGGRRG